MYGAAFRWLLALSSMMDPADRRASLHGEVTTPDGGAVPRAYVEVRCQGQLNVSRAAAGDERGGFAFAGLPPGRCRLHVQAAGHEGVDDQTLELRPGERQHIQLVLKPAPPPAERRFTRTLQLAEGLPLPARRLEAIIQLTGALDADRGAGGAVLGGTHFGAGYTVDGFDVTDPLTPGLGPRLPWPAVATVTTTPAAFEHERSFASGAATDIVSVSGSNRWEGAARAHAGSQAVTRGLAPAGGVDGRLAGPLVRDYLWLMLAGTSHAGTGVEPPGGPAGHLTSLMGKLTWQAGPRYKLSLLGITDAESRQPGGRTGSLLGLRADLLLTDELVLSSRAALRAADVGGRRADAGEITTRLDWFFARTQALAASMRVGVLSLDSGAIDAAPSLTHRRGVGMLEHSWRLNRQITLTSALTYAVGQLEHARSPAATRPSPRATLAWDVTGDGRTALRLAAGEVADLGSLAAHMAAAGALAPAARNWEWNFGAERELPREASVRLDIGGRWRPSQLPGDDRSRRHDGASLGLQVPRTRWSLRGQARVERGERTGVLASGRLDGTVALLPSVHLGALAAWDDRRPWLSLLEPFDGDLAPIDTVAARSLVGGAQLRQDLGIAIGLPVVVSADVFAVGRAARLQLALQSGF